MTDHLCQRCGHAYTPRATRGGKPQRYCSAYCRHKRPTAVRKTAEERLWEKVDRSGGPDACWPFRGGTMGKGYGSFWDGERLVTASSFVLRLTLGRDLLPDMRACHTCDNPPCCNPAHLFEGTQADNLADMLRKGRQFAPTKAIDPQELLHRYDTLGWSQQKIADFYEVHQTSISRAIRRAIAALQGGC